MFFFGRKRRALNHEARVLQVEAQVRALIIEHMRSLEILLRTQVALKEMALKYEALVGLLPEDVQGLKQTQIN